MRCLQVLGCVVMIFFSHSALAIQLTEAQLDELGSLLTQQSLDAVFHESVADLDKHLEGLSASQAIWLKHQWLRKLASLTHPSAQQQLWLTGQLASDESLTLANSEHPDQLLSIINIARQAKTSLQLWKINQQVEYFQNAWGTVRWNWQDVVDPQNDVLQQAFSLWIASAEPALAEQVAEGYLSLYADLSQHHNRVLAVLAEHAKSAELFTRLWQQAADEYSYQALAKLPILFDEALVIEQTIQANNNKQLQSQALFLLAKSYSHDHRAQQALLVALDTSEARWFAAAVLSKISDRNFLDDLDKKMSRQNPSGLRKLALKNIQQAKEQGVVQ